VSVANDDAVFELSFREWKASVWTDVFHREDPSVDLIQTDVDFFDTDS
jgi:hypothetical protein